MSKIHFHQTTTLTPEQYIAGLTDFSPGRSKIFSKSADDYLKVHSVGPAEADVTEGSGGVWERLHYDWSDPDRVVLTDHRLQRVGRIVGLHLYLQAAAGWGDRGRRRHRPGGQERQGAAPRAGARDSWKGSPRQGVRQERQSDRGRRQRAAAR